MLKKIMIVVGVILLIGVMATPMARAAVPLAINVQGVFDGAMPDDGGTVTVHLKSSPSQQGTILSRDFYVNSGGTPVVELDRTTGFFSLTLDGLDPAQFTSPTSTLMIAIDGQGIENQLLAAVPYALRAAVAESLAEDIYVNLGGDTMSGGLISKSLRIYGENEGLILTSLSAPPAGPYTNYKLYNDSSIFKLRWNAVGSGSKDVLTANSAGLVTIPGDLQVDGNIISTGGGFVEKAGDTMTGKLTINLNDAKGQLALRDANLANPASEFFLKSDTGNFYLNQGITSATGYVTRLTVNGSGDVGIGAGATSPVAKLHIDNPGAGSDTQFYSATNGNTYIRALTGSDIVMDKNSVGIGT
ncbi:hypothetical protein ACFL37_02365, partial [Candidatus Margulisiibacteriota bacterium]